MFAERQTNKDTNCAMEKQENKADLPKELKDKIGANKLNLHQLEEVIANYSLSFYDFNLIGMSLHAQNQQLHAEQAYTYSILLNSRYDAPYGNLINLYVEQGNFKACKDLFVKAMNELDDSSYVLYQYGRAEFVQKHFDNAFSLAMQALRLAGFTHEPAALLAIQALLFRVKEQKSQHPQNDMKEAYMIWRAALAEFPDSEPLNSYSSVFQQFEDYISQQGK